MAPQRRTARRPSSRRPLVSASRSVSAGPNSFAPTSSSMGLPIADSTIPLPAISSSVWLARMIRNSASRTMSARPSASNTVSSGPKPRPSWTSTTGITGLSIARIIRPRDARNRPLVQVHQRDVVATLGNWGGLHYSPSPPGFSRSGVPAEPHRKGDYMTKKYSILLLVAAAGLLLALRPGGAAGPTGWTVVAWNNLGMHCMDADFGVFAILPPYNTIQAQVVDASGKRVTDPARAVLTYEAVADPTGSDQPDLDREDELLGQRPEPLQGLPGRRHGPPREEDAGVGELRRSRWAGIRRSSGGSPRGSRSRRTTTRAGRTSTRS